MVSSCPAFLAVCTEEGSCAGERRHVICSLPLPGAASCSLSSPPLTTPLGRAQVLRVSILVRGGLRRSRQTMWQPQNRAEQNV